MISRTIGANRITFPFSPSSFTRSRLADNDFNIKGYTTADTRIGHEAKDGAWKVMVWGKNLFATYYWNTVITCNDSQGSLAGLPATYRITFGFELKYASSDLDWLSSLGHRDPRNPYDWKPFSIPTSNWEWTRAPALFIFAGVCVRQRSPRWREADERIAQWCKWKLIATSFWIGA
jgi:hypothetical protein